MTRKIVLFVVTLVAVCECQLPSIFKVCPKNSQNLANCVRDAVDHVKPYLKTGDFGNGWKIDGLEPMRIDNINLERGRGFFVSLSNVLAYKISNFKTEKLRINPDTFNLDVIVNIQNVDVTGDYKMNILIGLANIKGDGKFKALIDNIRVHLKFKSQKYTKNGEEYVKFESVQTKIKMSGFKITIKDLFKGDKVLNDVTNAIINQNIHNFITDIEPRIQNSIERSAMTSGNQILEKVPFKFILTIINSNCVCRTTP